MDFHIESFLPYRLFQAAEHTSRAFYLRYRDEFGLTRTEWRVLFNIGQYGPLSASEVARRSGLEKPKISRAVLRLEEKGWVERQYSRENRRSHQLGLTRLGCDNFDRLCALASDFDKEILRALDRASLQDLLEQLEKIEAVNLDPEG